MITLKIVFGKKANRTNFGRIGCSHGAKWGGYNNYYYGVKWLIALKVFEGWGESSKPHPLSNW